MAPSGVVVVAKDVDAFDVARNCVGQRGHARCAAAGPCAQARRFMDRQGVLDALANGEAEQIVLRRKHNRRAERALADDDLVGLDIRLAAAVRVAT